MYFGKNNPQSVLSFESEKDTWPKQFSDNFYDFGAPFITW